jgi:DNA topoisomerase-6 subunit A
MAKRKPQPALDASASTDKDAIAIQFIDGIASHVRDAIAKGELPTIDILLRGLGNVTYDPEKGYLELGEVHKTRTLSVNTIRSFAQTLRLMATSREMVRSDDYATKREAYYISKNWGDCRFDSQPESDAVMDDIEALASRYGLSREQLRFYADSHGGAVAGELVVTDPHPETGAELNIDCRNLGTGAYGIPRSVEHLRFRTNAEFILAIETGGMFQRLNNHQFWKKTNCILVEMAGVPTRATRRFLRRLTDSTNVPVYCFVDCDPYGFANIYRTLKAGSGNAAHINQFYCVPRARFLGVTPKDIHDYGLEDATHPLTKTDVKRAKDAIKNDPFFAAHPEWVSAIEGLVAMGVRAEQQALAKWGLNFVMDEYLPRKLADQSSFLP